MRNAIIVHSLDHALAAASAAEAFGQPLTLCGALGSAGNLGVGWFAALRDLTLEKHPSVDLAILIDCLGEGGTALGALRRGLNVVFTGHETARQSISAIAASLGLIVLDKMPDALDLLLVRDLEAACGDLFVRIDVASQREVAPDPPLR